MGLRREVPFAFYCCAKHYSYIQFQEERVYFISQCIFHHDAKAESWNRGYGGTLLTNLLPKVHSACFFID